MTLDPEKGVPGQRYQHGTEKRQVWFQVSPHEINLVEIEAACTRHYTVCDYQIREEGISLLETSVRTLLREKSLFVSTPARCTPSVCQPSEVLG